MDPGKHESDQPPDGVGFDIAHVVQPGSDEAEEQNHREHLGAHVAESAGEGAAAESMESGAVERGTRRHRRVKTKPVAGSDPNPQPEPRRHSGDENDDRLKADKPPHWG